MTEPLCESAGWAIHKEPICTSCEILKRDQQIAKLVAERERYRQIAEHMFSPAETDPDTCRRCSLDFRDPVHTRLKPLNSPTRKALEGKG